MVATLFRRVPFAARLSLAFLFLIAGTDRTAYQDLASLFVQQPGVAERARTFLLSNPFAKLRTATFSLPSPLGMAIPKLPFPDHFRVLNASLSPTDYDIAIRKDEPEPQIVDRSIKGDRLVPTEPEAVPHIETVTTAPAGAHTADEETRWAELEAAEMDYFEIRADMVGTLARSLDPLPPAGVLGRVSRLFFGTTERDFPPLAFHHRPKSPAEKLRLAGLPGISMDDGSSVARKGVVTGDDATLKSPAERLGLTGEALAKAQKCLADAIYFESRGEVERGQIAVAQVIINRVFSGYYPEDVCGTVYQNAHRHLACQFTFACEGKKLVVNDPRSWERATRISNDMLDGKLWLAEIGKATHYHANWVRPRWIRGMRRIHEIGVHTFYRPRNWDEG